jgi:hypothetical protein
MCFGSGLKGEKMPDIDANMPVRAISIVGNPSPSYSHDPAGESRASMPASQNAHALAALMKMRTDGTGDGELMTKGRDMGERPPEEVRRKGSYSRYLM